jgi:MFS family permease
VGLGVTSALTDVSSEMVNSILPLYLMSLGLGTVAFGVFDGVYQGMTVLLRLAGGVLADRTRRYKEVAGFGYLLSAVCKLGLLAVTSAAAVAAVLMADRTGKGIRTAPRDALIAHSSPPGRMATSFGIHRALDTAGALAGPLLAFVLLGVTEDDYNAVFITSFCVALIGFAVLACFVQNRDPQAGDDTDRAAASGSFTASVRAAVGLLQLRHFRRVVVAGCLLGLVTVSDAFIFLTLRNQTGMRMYLFPLLFAGTMVGYLVLAIPFGRLADRVGTVPVFLGGHVFLGCAYLMLLQANGGVGLAEVAPVLVLLGSYYAATDGVLAAMAAAAVPAGLRASGLALVSTFGAGVRLVGSVAFGLAWQRWGAAGAVTVFGVALLVALPAAAALLAGGRPKASLS